MPPGEKLYVCIDRDDGSRTYKGPWVWAHADRERKAWNESFPTYSVVLLTRAEARADVARWTKAIRRGATRYFPQEVS